jgi:hypothetical protein
MNTPTLKQKHEQSKEEKFFRRLKEIYGIGYDEFKSDYQYAGGDGNLTEYNYHKISQLIGETKYAVLRGITPEMMHNDLETGMCLCGHIIKNHMYIQDKKDKSKIIVLGNICIKKYKGKQRHCFCGNLHKNRKDNLCNDCRKKIKKILKPSLKPSQEIKKKKKSKKKR